MAVTSSRRSSNRRDHPDVSPLALAVADANWYTTENLFGELDRPGTSTLLLKCLDYYNAWRQGARLWERRRLARQSDTLWQRQLVLPTGWMKRFPTWGMRPISRSISRWRSEFAPDGPLALVMTYPHYLYLRDRVKPDKSVYFNIDDYSQYWPHCADRVNELERQAVREADLTVCVSRFRSEELRRSVPEATSKIHHLPHGAPSISIGPFAHKIAAAPPEDLAKLPGPRLGFVGSLEDRIDWALLSKLADAFPKSSIVLIGRQGSQPAGSWQEERSRCLARPNVHSLGWKSQVEISRYYAAFDVCLIPYRSDHPFNRACCPTKIMDGMGTGRPIVSTDLPECLLYQDLFDVVADAESFVESVRSLEKAGFDDGRAEQRYAWAVEHSCARTAQQLMNWLL